MTSEEVDHREEWPVCLVFSKVPFLFLILALINPFFQGRFRITVWTG